MPAAPLHYSFPIVKHVKLGAILIFVLLLSGSSPSWSGAFSAEKQKEALLEGKSLQTDAQKKKVLVGVRSLATEIKSSALEQDWKQYCDNLSEYSWYNLAIHYKTTKETKSCQAAIKENNNLAALIELQANRMKVTAITPSNENAALVTVISGGQELDFVALREKGYWKADLHPPINMSQYRNVKKMAGGDSSDSYSSIIQNRPTNKEEEIYIPSGVCLQAFLVKPLRNEISVRLNDQVTSPLATRLGL